MDVDRESKKRGRGELEKGSEKEDEYPEEENGSLKNRKIAKRGVNKIVSDDEDNLSTHSGLQMSVKENLSTNPKELARHTLLLSDDDEAECYAITGPERKKGEEARIGVFKEDGKPSAIIKRGRGRPKKIHRKKIGLDELGVHEVEDSEDSEGYDVLSAPEMAATAIEYLEEADQIRIKCKNIKGDLSGVMKRRIHNAKEIIKGLTRTITKAPQRKEGGEEDEDETRFLRMENKELKTRLKEKEKDCQKKEKEIQILRNEVKEIGEQMKLLKEEIIEMKRYYGKTSKVEISPRDRNGRRMHRTLKAIENGEDTSIAEDSEAMEIERMPTCEWSGVEDDQCFKKPYSRSPDPVSPGPSAGRGGSLLLRHLKQKEERLTRKAMEESLRDYQEIREKVRKHGTIAQEGQAGMGMGRREEFPELPKPQRPPKVTQPRGIRTDIKVLGNVQIKKPRIEGSEVGKELKRKEESTKKEVKVDQEWEVKKSRKEIQESKKKIKEEQKIKQDRKPNLPKEKPKMVRRLPRSSAVTLRIAEENKDKYSYAEILRTAREKISLEEIGIGKTRIRKTAGGNILIAIPGVNRGTEADRLAEELTKVLDKEITVNRPNIMGELRLFGLDDSISKQEIIDTISTQGKCKPIEIRTSDIKIMRNGLSMIWVKCPLQAAAQLSKLGKIRIGWSIIKVELLQAREKQCFRCWRFGHLKYNCKSEVDRTGCCYRCGSSQHKVKECNNEAICVVCKENHAEWHHRIGSIACVRNRKINKDINKTDIKNRESENITHKESVNNVHRSKTDENMEVCVYNNNDDHSRND